MGVRFCVCFAATAATRDLVALPLACAVGRDSAHNTWAYASVLRLWGRIGDHQSPWSPVRSLWHAFCALFVICSPFTIAGFWEMNGFAVTRVAFTKQYSGGSRGAVNAKGSTRQHTRVEYRGQVSHLM